MPDMDRKLIAKSQQYEVKYFAKKHKLTMGEARAIIQQSGPKREGPTTWLRSRKR